MDAVFQTDGGVFNYRVAGVWIKEGHVLLHKNVKDNHWALPGGRVKIMEASKVGLGREFQEELQLDVEVQRLLWTTENFFRYDEKSYHELAFYYKVTEKEAVKLQTAAFQGMEEGKTLIYQWIPLAKLAEIPLQPSFLKRALQDIPAHPAHIVINDG